PHSLGTCHHLTESFLQTRALVLRYRLAAFTALGTGRSFRRLGRGFLRSFFGLHRLLGSRGLLRYAPLGLCFAFLCLLPFRSCFGLHCLLGLRSSFGPGLLDSSNSLYLVSRALARGLRAC